VWLVSETKQPCDLHAWQPVPLPDGRTVILCGKCGEHAVTLDAAPWSGATVAPADGANTSLPKPPNDGRTFIWPPIGGQEPPRPVFEYQPEPSHPGVVSSTSLVGYSIADMMSGTSAPGSGIRLT
jgi:hypothetical protein